jgi:hypothetical protein
MAVWPTPAALVPYDANLAARLKPAPYDASVAKCPLHLPASQNPQPANAVAGLRRQCGNWETKYDRSVAIWQKPYAAPSAIFTMSIWLVTVTSAPLCHKE